MEITGTAAVAPGGAIHIINKHGKPACNVRSIHERLFSDRWGAGKI